MQEHSFDDLKQHVTPAWLTRVLRTQGHLPYGAVTQLAITRVSETPPAVQLFMHASYSADAPAAPAQLFFKAPKPHKLLRGRQESHFYTALAPQMPDVPLVPCYSTGPLNGTGVFYVLLADVSATHAPPPRFPAQVQLEQIVDALARLHAAWWERADLPALVGESPDAGFAADFAGSEQQYRVLVEQLGELLTPAYRRIFERFLADGPALLLKRARSGQSLTLCHPENHHENVLLPRGAEGPVFLIDWHQYRCWWGVKDVVSLLMRCVPPEAGQPGQDLLRYYYQRLQRYGVAGYSWDCCWDDYRLAVIDNLALLLKFRKDPAWIMPRLNDQLQEFQAIGCFEMF
jgi:hypothetical protein